MSEAEEARTWGSTRPRPTEERFWEKVDRSGGPNACWPWRASLMGNGYGQFFIRHGHAINAHRFAWQVAHDAEAGEFDVLHSCDNRVCCNPAHLSLGTPSENGAQMVWRGRARWGVQSAAPKLSPERVREARARVAAGETRASVAQSFGVDKTLIAKVIRGEIWRHVR